MRKLPLMLGGICVLLICSTVAPGAIPFLDATAAHTSP